VTNTTTDPARWQLVKDLLAQALDLAPEERARFLDGACAGDPGLRSEIESLLAFSQDAEARLHSLPQDWIADAALAPGRSWIGRRLGLPRLIGFDMGGTSTDVSLIDGDLPRRFEHLIAGVRLLQPMLDPVEHGALVVGALGFQRAADQLAGVMQLAARGGERLDLGRARLGDLGGEVIDGARLRLRDRGHAEKAGDHDDADCDQDADLHQAPRGENPCVG